MKDLPPMGHRPRKSRPLLVSFSGIDGAGKSTQILHLKGRLARAGLRFRLLAFWDDVATLRRARERSSHSLFKGEKGIGSPEHPVDRRDKNIQSWYMTIIRCVLYGLDAAALCRAVTVSAQADVDVIIFDRYLYDELANLPLKSRLIQAYARLLLKVVPMPDIAYLLDADPVQAHQRKPEYPLEFVYRNRASYLALSGLVGGMTVIQALPAGEVAHQVEDELFKKLPRGGERAISSLLCGQDNAGLEAQVLDHQAEALQFHGSRRISGQP